MSKITKRVKWSITPANSMTSITSDDDGLNPEKEFRLVQVTPSIMKKLC